MEKRTSDYKVIVGDENTINSQLAGDETVCMAPQSHGSVEFGQL
jgi:hypothetical protein